MRGALSSLLLLCSLLGRWIARAAVAFFEASWRNQKVGVGLYNPDCSKYKEISMANSLRLPAVGVPLPAKNARRVERHRRQCLQKRLRPSPFSDMEDQEERPIKRLRRELSALWRFWLPHSFEMEEDEPGRALFAGEKTEDRIELPESQGEIDRSIPFGEGCCPVKLRLENDDLD
ncbi:unnamed protein product [Linum trigynum]|uniref:Uncharacterized protein n=1 Tax=Linum trigynum TaxID=586398 RepID=A0AAV2CFD6_9ROSI